MPKTYFSNGTISAFCQRRILCSFAFVMRVSRGFLSLSVMLVLFISSFLYEQCFCLKFLPLMSNCFGNAVSRFVYVCVKISLEWVFHAFDYARLQNIYAVT